MTNLDLEQFDENIKKTIKELIAMGITGDEYDFLPETLGKLYCTLKFLGCNPLFPEDIKDWKRIKSSLEQIATSTGRTILDQKDPRVREVPAYNIIELVNSLTIEEGLNSGLVYPIQRALTQLFKRYDLDRKKISETPSDSIPFKKLINPKRSIKTRKYN